MTVAVQTVRTALDFEQFRELAVEYEESLDADLRHADFASEFAALHEHYADPNAAFVAAVDAQPAGCVVLCELAGSVGLIKKMYVRPGYRNRGVARSLMTAVIDRARRRFYTELVLDTERRRLSAAYSLYRSIGFEECEPYGGVDYACPTFMRLPL
jgi:GNAT superfamily N-acetyltransferase